MWQWWRISHLELTYWVVCMLKASLNCYYGLHLTCSCGLTFTWWECSSNKACPPLFLILLFVTSPSLAHSPVFHFLNILPTELCFPFHSWVLTSAMIFLSVGLPACCGIFRVLHETGLLTSPKEKYQDRLAHFTQRKISKSSRWRWFAYLILPIACQFNIFFKNSSNQGHKAFQNR